jgi:hypothetical protein
MIYFCSQKNRRALVLQHPGLNGIDYLEVSSAGAGCMNRLLVTLLKDGRGATLGVAQIRITGGAPKAQVSVASVSLPTDAAPRVVAVDLNQSGDFSTYTFSFVADSTTTDPPDGFDPQLSTIPFSFKAGCPTVGDCLPVNCCPPEQFPEPDINYMTKDYPGFRQVMLDRLAVLTPTWTETHPSDTGMALAEALAYAADHLSYQQDAAATEAYIGTARSRISLRRHAKLVDYRISEGSNARTWAYLKLDKNHDGVVIPAGTLLFPLVPGLPPSISPGGVKPDQVACDVGLLPRAAAQLVRSSATIFATMQDSTLFQEQNSMQFYTWGDTNCCLANGAVEATLTDTLSTLVPGAILVFQEMMGPDTGDPNDADPARRWAVRLTGVQTTDHLGRVLTDPLFDQPVTRITWAPEDAPPFPICISSRTDAAHGSKLLPAVSVAMGNIVPADHGIWQCQEDLGAVPPPPATPVLATSCQCNQAISVPAPRPRYFPQLSKSPVTFAFPLDNTLPASQFLAPQSSGTVLPAPQIEIVDDQNQPWTVLHDLLSSDDSKRVCVLEIERDGTAFVRFGDGQYGEAPEQGADFRARYRVGNGSAGNIGRDSLAHILTNVAGVEQVNNPLAAAGGVDAETMDHIRQLAPFAFRTQLRAVTENDYGDQARQDPTIQQARGTLRWTGSWYTAFVSLETQSGDPPGPALVKSTTSRLNLLRMAGVDLAVEGAVIVGLRIEMNICVAPDWFQSDVRTALLQLFTTGNQCTGAAGLLNPANFTFGETIHASPLIAAAQGVEGVVTVTLTVFQRMDNPSIDGVAQGYLTMGRLEIARCDNDPNRLDHGILVFHMDGGK